MGTVAQEEGVWRTRLRSPRWLVTTALCLTTVGMVVAIVCAVALGDGVWGPRDGIAKGSDFICFYAGGKIVSDGNIDELYTLGVYRPIITDLLEQPRTSYSPRYPPPLYTGLAPLCQWGFVPAVRLFSFVFFFVGVLGTWVLSRAVPLVREQEPLIFWTGCLAFVPLNWAILTGHISAVLLVLTATAAVSLRKGRPFLAGLALGLCAYKPPFAVAIFAGLLATMRFRLLLGAGCGVALLFASFVGITGLEPWTEWLAHASRYGRDLERLMRFPERMHTFRAFLALLTPESWRGGVRLVAFSLGAGVLLLAGSCHWRRRTVIGQAELLRFGAVLSACLLAAPHLYDYDVGVFLVPLAALFEAALAAEGRRRKRLLALVFLAYVIFPICLLTPWLKVQWSVPVIFITCLACIKEAWVHDQQ